MRAEVNTSCCGDDLTRSDDDGNELVWTAEEHVGSKDAGKENVGSFGMLRLILTAEEHVGSEDAGNENVGSFGMLWLILTAEVEEKHVMCA